jgi:hypothetical protein
MARGELTERCATVGCGGEAQERILYRYRGQDEWSADDVCSPCADDYARRVALVNFSRAPIP